MKHLILDVPCRTLKELETPFGNSKGLYQMAKTDSPCNEEVLE